MKRENTNSREPRYSIDTGAYLAIREQEMQRDALAAQLNLARLDKAGMATKAVANAGYEVLVKAPVRAGWEVTKATGRGLLNLAGLAGQFAIAGGQAYFGALMSLTEPREQEDNGRNEQIFNAGYNAGFEEGSYRGNN